MIHVDRNRQSPPERFASVAEKEIARLEESVGKDRRPKFRPPTLVKGVRETLFQLFHGKCVYCETLLEKIGAGQLDLFRPRQNARGHSASGKEEWFYRHHYWWLSWEWRNLYLSCEVCNRNKGTWFPVVGERAAERASWEDLESEQRLFIDPCVDDPEEYFVYDEKGVAHSKAANSKEGEWREERAETTIKLLGLNRSQLVEARRERMGRLESSLWEIWLDDPDGPADPGLVAAAAPFAGACRHLERQLREEREQAAGSRRSGSFSTRGGVSLGIPLDPVPDLPPRYRSGTLEGEPPEETAQEEMTPEEATPEDLGTETLPLPQPGIRKPPPVPVEAPPIEEPRPDLSRVTAFLQKVTLSNFRAIEHLTLDFSLDAKPPELAVTVPAEAAEDLDEAANEALEEGPSTRVGWWVLLGENGSGKSSVLQAVALGLAGQARSQAVLDEMGIEAKSLQRRVPRGAPAPGKLRVEIELSNEPHRIVYRLEGDGLHFEEGGTGAQSVVRAYGTSRLPPRRRKKPLSDKEQKKAKELLLEPVKIESLFDPHETLIDPEAWLLDQDDFTFKRAALALADLFRLPEGAVSRDPALTEVRVQRDQDSSPLAELSDGYQALTGLVAHLMAAVPKGISDFQQENGIVLIDELGVHLHPRWRMNIVKSLRTAFPQFQFLATTHEPLCLRGLETGEVGVMYRLPSGLSVIDKEVPSPAGLRVDQLLTSSHFSLSTTIDPDLDLQFEEYYRLLAKDGEGQLAPLEKGTLKDLKVRLAGHRVLGYTRQDQLVYELIGKYLGQEKGLKPEGRRELKEKTKTLVLEAWERVSWAQKGRT